MNKIPLLEKFAAQSLVYVDTGLDDGKELVFSKEKFAELIVQETMQVVANQLPSNQYLDVADAVIKHFGVEEWTGNNATLC